MAYRDPAEGRRKDRERTARLTAARIAAGLCTRCGGIEPLPERRLCAPCNEKRNAASRARDAHLRAAGKPRRDPERAKLYERERSRRLHAERREYASYYTSSVPIMARLGYRDIGCRRKSHCPGRFVGGGSGISNRR